MIFGGAALGARWLWKLSQASGQVEAWTKVSIHHVGFSKNVLRVDVTIKNPSKVNVALTQPFVKLEYNGEIIGSSVLPETPEDSKAYVIKAGTQQELDPVMVEIPTSLTTVGGIVKDLADLLTGKKSALEMKSITSAAVTAGGITTPYEKVEQHKITLNKQG